MSKRSKKQKLEDKAWKVFSKWVRERDTDWRGFGVCISCQKTKPYADLDAGHYISRDKKIIKFDERNVHAQCQSCNRFHSGNIPEYAHYLDIKLGEGMAETLRRESHQSHTFTEKELEEIIKKYG